MGKSEHGRFWFRELHFLFLIFMLIRSFFPSFLTELFQSFSALFIYFAPADKLEAEFRAHS